MTKFLDCIKIGYSRKYISDNELTLYESKNKSKKLQIGLCSTFTPSIKGIEADHAMDIIMDPECT